jgi:gliding motility-associated protein GldM
MMTKPKFGQKTNLRFLTILPLTILLFTGVACINGQKADGEKKTVAAVAPTKMNVLYLGLDNPVSIAVSGYEASELNVKVDSNGRILGDNGKYIIRPIRPGALKVFVYAGDELVSETHFRVKTVPDPVAKIAGKKGGTISKPELLDAAKIYVEMENFDFDLSWEIVSFVMSASVPGSSAIREEISHSGKFSDNQIDLINSLEENQKLMIEEIKAKGPDGAIRKMGSMVFTISSDRAVLELGSIVLTIN